MDKHLRDKHQNDMFRLAVFQKFFHVYNFYYTNFEKLYKHTPNLNYLKIIMSNYVMKNLTQITKSSDKIQMYTLLYSSLISHQTLNDLLPNNGNMWQTRNERAG